MIKQIQKLQNSATKLLADRELASKLENIKTESEWEELLQSKVSNEEILKQNGELTKKKILEMAKDEIIKSGIGQPSGHIEGTSISYDDLESERAVKKFLENNLHLVSMYSIKLNSDDHLEVAKMDKILAPEELDNK